MQTKMFNLSPMNVNQPGNILSVQLWMFKIKQQLSSLK